MGLHWLYRLTLEHWHLSNIVFWSKNRVHFSIYLGFKICLSPTFHSFSYTYIYFGILISYPVTLEFLHRWSYFGEGNCNPLQYSCLENPLDRGGWWAAVYGVIQSRTWLKRLSMHACIEEGNSNPLQCSCLENPRDRGAWWAAVYGVTQSWTRLKRLSSGCIISLNSNSICLLFLFAYLIVLVRHLAPFWTEVVKASKHHCLVIRIGDVFSVTPSVGDLSLFSFFLACQEVCQFYQSLKRNSIWFHWFFSPVVFAVLCSVLSSGPLISDL